MNGEIQETQEIEVTKFPTTISKWEFASRYGGNNSEYGGESETGSGGGSGESG